MDERGLAHAGGARHHEQLGRAPARPREGGDQHRPLPGAAVELLREQEARGHVVPAELEGRERRALGEVAEALAQVGDQALGALVAILGVLGEQLEGHLRERARDARPEALGRGRRLAELPVEERGRIGAGEGDLAGEHLVEGDAERVEVGAEVDAAVDAAGLLGRDVGQRPVGPHRPGERRLFAALAQGVVEVGDLDLAGLDVDQDARRLDALVDHPPRVERAQDAGDLGGDPHRLGDLHPPAGQHAAQGAPAEVLEDDGEAPLLFHGEDARHARHVERLGRGGAVAEAGQDLGARLGVAGRSDQDRPITAKRPARGGGAVLRDDLGYRSLGRRAHLSSGGRSQP